jgi:hypothetical protein
MPLKTYHQRWLNRKVRRHRGSGSDGAYRSNVKYECGYTCQMTPHGCPKTIKGTTVDMIDKQDVQMKCALLCVTCGAYQDVLPVKDNIDTESSGSAASVSAQTEQTNVIVNIIARMMAYILSVGLEIYAIK